ncbi:MAG: hypothetical protein C4308_01420 [Chitinophagaceae bacterium]
MKAFKFLLSLIVLAAIFFACQKERSFESGNGGTPSDGSLQGAGSNCLGSTVNGTYKKDSTLNAGHNVDVKVDVNVPGAYLIYTDTVNGMYFRATGTFSTAGVATVKLQGYGKPLAAGTNTFNVYYDSTTCSFTVSTLPGGASGGTALYTVNCGGAVDSVAIGSPVTATDTVHINVNVTTAGTWAITTTTIQNVTYSGSGTFTTTGAQTIVLSASGTPSGTATSTQNFSISSGTSTCSFPVTFVAPPDYFPTTNNSNWSYELDDDPTDTIYQYVNGTITIGANTYSLFWINNGFSTDSGGYYRKNNSKDYFQRYDAGSTYGFDNPIWIEQIILKDYVPVGSTWNTIISGTSGGTPVSLRIKATIQAPLNGTVVVNSLTFPNTIIVRNDYDYSLDGGTTWVPIDYWVLFYYSRGVGLVKAEDFDSSGLLFKQEITRYQIF